MVVTAHPVCCSHDSVLAWYAYQSVVTSTPRVAIESARRIRTTQSEVYFWSRTFVNAPCTLRRLALFLRTPQPSHWHLFPTWTTYILHGTFVVVNDVCVFGGWHSRGTSLTQSCRSLYGRTGVKRSSSLPKMQALPSVNRRT